jgi:peptidyl-prolyl cis-trans isomerase C
MDQPHRRSGYFCALLACLLLSATPAVVLAQDTETEEDPTVAVVDGTPILHSEVTAYAATLPAQYQQSFDQIFPFLVQRLIDLALIDEAATSDGLAEDEVVRERVARLRTEVMREVYMERLLAAAVGDQEIEARYQALLETEEEAREVIAALDGGIEFADLASERSTGPSAAQGGDLGYFTGEQMVPSFAEAAFALDAPPGRPRPRAAISATLPASRWSPVSPRPPLRWSRAAIPAILCRPNSAGMSLWSKTSDRRTRPASNRSSRSSPRSSRAPPSKATSRACAPMPRSK